MHVIEHKSIFQVMVHTLDQIMDKQPKETVLIHACYIHIQHVIAMHACHLTQTYISGYGAHAGTNNGQATKGNGITYMHSTFIHNMRVTLI